MQLYILAVLLAPCLTSELPLGASLASVVSVRKFDIIRNDKYLNMGGPLLAGVTVVALSSLAPMALPLGMRSLAVTEAISLYGGLAVFGGFVLFE